MATETHATNVSTSDYAARAAGIQYWRGEVRVDEGGRESQSVTSRRAFLEAVFAGLAALGGVVVAIPLIGSLWTTSQAQAAGHYSAVAPFSSIPEGVPTHLTFPDSVTDAFMTSSVVRDVWVVKNGSQTTVFSPICTHLGCHYAWDAGADHFICPCHGSVFTIKGDVVSGPAPRPLDTLPHKVENDTLYVEYEQFESGAPTKIKVSG